MSMEWISAKDRLPELGDNILIYHAEYGIGIGYYLKLDDSFAGTFHGIPVIDQARKSTHWMPLPEPPNQPQ